MTSRWGSGCRGRVRGSSSMRFSRRATQSATTGQCPQSGVERRHTIAPKSISACVYGSIPARGNKSSARAQSPRRTAGSSTSSSIP